MIPEITQHDLIVFFLFKYILSQLQQLLPVLSVTENQPAGQTQQEPCGYTLTSEFGYHMKGFLISALADQKHDRAHFIRLRITIDFLLTHVPRKNLFIGMSHVIFQKLPPKNFAVLIGKRLICHCHPVSRNRAAVDVHLKRLLPADGKLSPRMTHALLQNRMRTVPGVHQPRYFKRNGCRVPPMMHILHEHSGIIGINSGISHPVLHCRRFLFFQCVMTHHHLPHHRIRDRDLMYKQNIPEQLRDLRRFRFPEILLVKNRVILVHASLSQRFHRERPDITPIVQKTGIVFLPVQYDTGIEQCTFFLRKLGICRKIHQDLLWKSLPRRLVISLHIIFVEPCNTEIMKHSLLIPRKTARIHRISLDQQLADRLKNRIVRIFLVPNRKDPVQRPVKVLLVIAQKSSSLKQSLGDKIVLQAEIQNLNHER